MGEMFNNNTRVDVNVKTMRKSCHRIAQEVYFHFSFFIEMCIEVNTQNLISLKNPRVYVVMHAKPCRGSLFFGEIVLKFDAYLENDSSHRH